MGIERKHFGVTADGTDVYSYTLTNKNGMQATLITLGAALQSLLVPDKHGKLRDVVVGFDDVAGFEQRSDYQGVTVGRYCNRIAGGKMRIGGKTYDLTRNEREITCLHGGGEFSKAVWTPEVTGENEVAFSYTSPDGAEGFPGEMTAQIEYALTEENELVLRYSAVCTADTYINFTNHTYFNLAGQDSGDVLDTTLRIRASRYLPTDADSIPTGELRDVTGTAFDFREEKPIGRDIGQDDPQLVQCRGYDHNYCLDTRPENAPAVEAHSPRSGVRMQVFTDLPGVQLYTGNFLSGKEGKDGVGMYAHAGFCLETQFYPDTPHRPEFPTCLFKAGETFTSRTSFRFV